MLGKKKVVIADVIEAGEVKATKVESGTVYANALVLKTTDGKVIALTGDLLNKLANEGVNQVK